MALVNDTSREIYIRVPRTGGSSLVHRMNDWMLAGTDHSSASQTRALVPMEWESYRTWGVIRNPWDWLVSAYSVGWYLGPDGESEPWPGNRVEPFDSPFLEHYGQRTNLTFKEWVFRRKTTPMDWLSDELGILVEEVRRFEDLKDDLPAWEQKSDRRPYQDFYDNETRQYVSWRCRREIEIGRYVF